MGMRAWLLLGLVACGADDDGTGSSDETGTVGPHDTGPHTGEDTGVSTETGSTDTGRAPTTGDTGDTAVVPSTADLAFEVLVVDVDGYLSGAAFGDRDGDGVDELLVAVGGYAWSVVAPTVAATPPTVALTSVGAPLTDGFLASIDAGSSGDVDGDGLADVWVATHDAAYLFTSLPASATPMADAATASVAVRAGSVAFAGDVDGDGAVDVLLYDRDAEEVLWFEAPFAGQLTPADAVARFSDAGAAAVITPVGDVDGDGLPDVLVGSTDLGRAWLLANPAPSDATLDAAAVAVVGEPGSSFGSMVAAGDLDDDGVVDLWIGDLRNSWSATDAISGLSLLGSVAHTTIEQPDPDLGYGRATVVADLNGDGVDDLAVGSPFGYDRSAVYVVYGPVPRGAHLLTTLATAGLADVGYPEAHLGVTLGVLDLDHDGDAELAIGATNDATYYAGAGEARWLVREAL